MNEVSTKNGGLSLIEVVFSTMLVGMVVVGSLRLLGACARTEIVASELLTGPMLAEQMLAEIMSVSYEDPTDASVWVFGEESGEGDATRADFDDVDDYSNWSASPPQRKDGTVLPNLVGWTRRVDAYRMSVDDGDIAMLESGLKRVTVKVTSPTGEETELRCVRSRYGALEQGADDDRRVVTFVDSAITIGSGSTSTTASQTTNLLNHVEDPNG